MRSQLDSAQETTLQMRTECNDLQMEMSRAVPAHATAVKVCHTTPMSRHTLPWWPNQEEKCLHLFKALQVHLLCCLGCRCNLQNCDAPPSAWGKMCELNAIYTCHCSNIEGLQDECLHLMCRQTTS